MSRRFKPGFASGLLALIVFAACGDPPVIRVPGEPELCVLDASGAPAQCGRDELVLDFGPTLIGERQEKTLVLRNVGRADMTLTGAERADGAGENFAIPVTRSGLSVGQEVPLTAVFTPRGEGALSAVIHLRFSDATTDTFPLRLSGEGVKSGCVIEPSEAADFGSAAIGESWTTAVTIRNTSALPLTVTLGDIASETDAEGFAFDGIEPGEHTLAAHGELAVPISFKPNHLGPHTAFLSIPAPAACQPAVLRLQGNGVDQVLTWEPRAINFGYVNPGSRVTAELTFRNVGNVPVKVGELALADTEGTFSLDDPSLTSLEIAALGGEQTVRLAFLPTALGGRSTTLSFTTDSPRIATGTVGLTGWGGGPAIEVSPRALSFGQVGLGAWQMRRIFVANVGTDAPGTTADNLKFDVTGWEFAPKDAGFSAVLEGDASTGIAAGSSLGMQVRFSPTELGVRDAVLRIFSNASNDPVVEVALTGEGADLPPCDYEVLPPQGRFGYVAVGRTATQSLFVMNRSSSACVVSSLELSRTSANAFSLPAPIALPATVAPGEALEVPVRFAPATEGDFEAEVEFSINSLTAPIVTWPINGSSRGGCLTVVPNDADFGVQKINCTARERAFTIYSSCEETVNITSLDVLTGPSNKFRITQRPVLPYGLRAGHSVDFKATYRPTNVGEDVGSIAVQTAELGHPYIVKVAGRSAAEAIQTDVFAQADRAIIDILFVIDDSGSMHDKQLSLASNFDAFMRDASKLPIDFHIAVTSTTTDCFTTICDGSKAKDGRFTPEDPIDVPNPLTRVITPTTPNLAAAFRQNVMLGIDGRGTERPLEAAKIALSPQRLAAHNAGFLRPDAYLAIIFVTDTYDQSAGSADSYFDAFVDAVGAHRADELSISGIIPTTAGPTSDCVYDENARSISSLRLRDLVLRTGGMLDNICTTNWSKTLELLGRRVFGYTSHFPLTNSPDLGPGAEPIKVYVDGVEFPATGAGGTVHWSYDAANNAVEFEPIHTPEPGTTVRVVYPVGCIP